MYKNKKIIAIIPARSGSKGLRNKNIKEMNGKPLISYTIEAAIKSNIFDDIIVSTDSQEYADIAKKSGANVPFLRPNNISRDMSSTNQVIEYTLEQLKGEGKYYDYFMILQPTSPLRSYQDIQKSIKLLFDKKGTSVISVCESEHPSKLMNTLDDTLCMSNFLAKENNKRRQELPKEYRLNGAIYLCEVENFFKTKSFYVGKSYAYIMKKVNSIDIDDELDFKIAEVLIQTI